MSKPWKTHLRTDPLTALLAWQEPALQWFVRRDLLDMPDARVGTLQDLPEVQRLLRKQQADGSWNYPGKSAHPAALCNYALLETYRSLRLLVEQFGFDRSHPALSKAAGYVFACQTDEGDIRGILGNQYMPYYHSAILELLITAGYANDKRTRKALEWLLSMRQADGGWIIPAQQVPARQKTDAFWEGPPLPPERSRPHSHLATGMSLRALAVHPDYQKRPEVITAGERLKERFFQADPYYDRKAPSYWLKFQFPFWWPNLLTALDTLARLGFDRHDQVIADGLEWFAANQSADGLWETGYGSGSKAGSMRRWVGLAVCRVLKRYFEKDTHE